MKRLLTFLTALSLLLGIPITGSAHVVPQERDDCTITLTVRYDGENVNSGTLTAIKIGYVDEEDGNYFFSQVLTDARLEDISSSSAPKTQKAFYDNNKKVYDFYTQTQSVKKGKATFSGLSTGLYLIVQNKAAEGFSKMDPFLISVPYLDDGEYLYDVTAAVKPELKREPDPTDPTETKPGPKLPQTGQLNWPIPAMVIGGLALFVLGWELCFGKKRDPYA